MMVKTKKRCCLNDGKFRFKSYLEFFLFQGQINLFHTDYRRAPHIISGDDWEKSASFCGAIVAPVAQK